MSREVAHLGAIGDRVLEVKVDEGPGEPSLRTGPTNGVDTIREIHTGCTSKIPFRDDGIGCDNNYSDKAEE
jgi:hypothetical protein